MVGRNSRPTFEECPAGACPPPCSAQDPFDASVCEFGSRSLPGNPKTPKFLAADCPACLSGFAFVRQSSWPLRFTCIRWWSNWQRLEPFEPSPQPWQWRRLSLQHYPSGQGRGSSLSASYSALQVASTPICPCAWCWWCFVVPQRTPKNARCCRFQGWILGAVEMAWNEPITELEREKACQALSVPKQQETDLRAAAVADAALFQVVCLVRVSNNVSGVSL